MTLKALLSIVGTLASHFAGKRRCGHTTCMLNGIAKTTQPALILAANHNEAGNIMTQLPLPTKTQTTVKSLLDLAEQPLAHDGPVALDNSALAHLLSETNSHLARHAHAEFALESVKATLQDYRGETTAATLETMQHDINRALKAVDDYQSPDMAPPTSPSGQ
jgi:hypothetical protein